MSFEEEERRHCEDAASALWDRAFDQMLLGEQAGVSEDMFADMLIRERALALAAARELVSQARAAGLANVDVGDLAEALGMTP